MAKSAKAATAQANEPQVAAEAKKPAKRAAKKPAAEAPKKTENIYVQYGGKEWDAGELAEKAKAAYAAEGHRVIFRRPPRFQGRRIPCALGKAPFGAFFFCALPGKRAKPAGK